MNQKNDDGGDSHRLLALLLALLFSAHELAVMVHLVEHLDHLPHTEQMQQPQDVSGQPMDGWKLA